MAFSRQHFVKFAEILKKMSDRKSQLQLAAELLKLFKEDNPRFDSVRFLKAAGMEDSPALQQAMKESKKVNESFEGFGMKLTSLLPTGKLTELAFHGGNPTPDDIDVYADDFDDAFDDAENDLDELLDGILDMVHESELKDVESAVRQQVTLFRKAVGAFRANVEKIFDAKKKKLGGK